MRAEFLERVSYPQPETLDGENSLPGLIDHFNNNFQKEGLPIDWADLPGTGFQMDKQMNLLFSQSETESSYGREERMSAWLGQTEEDIKGFILEYLEEGLVFPINYKISLVDGQERVVAPLYGYKLMVDAVSQEERDGVVKRTISEVIEPFFLKSSEGSIAVMVSPAGPSGLKDQRGNSIIFPDSQTYIFQKRGDGVMGLTVRTDFTYQEHREFIRRLTGRQIPSLASVHEYISSPALIEGTMAEPPEILEIINVLRDTRFHITGSSFAYKDRMWTEVYSDLINRNRLLKFGDEVQDLINEFREYVLKNELSEKQIKEALAVTVLKIAKILRFDKRGLNRERDIIAFANKAYNDDGYILRFGRVLKDVQELPGCAGGGTGRLISSIVLRLGISSEKGWEYHIGECMVCGLKNILIGPCDICKNCEKKFDEFVT